MSGRPTVAVLIVSYNTRDLVDDLLASLQAEPSTVRHHIVVADNGSGDGVEQMVAEKYPTVEALRFDENFGFAGACNRLAAATDSDYILLLNPDTVVVPGLLEAFAEAADAAPDGALLGGRTLYPDGGVDPRSCFGPPTLWSTFCQSSGLERLFGSTPMFTTGSLGGWDRASVREVGFLSGCLLYCRRDVWEELGGFDERFFMYGEDTDLGARARALGYPSIFTPHPTIYHMLGASSAKRADKLVLLSRGSLTYIEKHWSGPKAWLGAAIYRGGVALRAAFAGAGPWRELWRRRAEWQSGYPPLPGGVHD